MTHDPDATHGYDPADEPAPAPRWTHPNDPAVEPVPRCNWCGEHDSTAPQHKGYCSPCQLLHAISELEPNDDRVYEAVHGLLEELQKLHYSWDSKSWRGDLGRILAKRRL